MAKAESKDVGEAPRFTIKDRGFEVINEDTGEITLDVHGVTEHRVSWEDLIGYEVGQIDFAQARNQKSAEKFKAAFGSVGT